MAFETPWSSWWRRAGRRRSTKARYAPNRQAPQIQPAMPVSRWAMAVYSSGISRFPSVGLSGSLRRASPARGVEQPARGRTYGAVCPGERSRLWSRPGGPPSGTRKLVQGGGRISRLAEALAQVIADHIARVQHTNAASGPWARAFSRHLGGLRSQNHSPLPGMPGC